MRLAVIIIGISSALVLGWKKGEQNINSEATPPQTEEPQATKAPKAAQVQTAEGHMKDLLLALRRVHFPFDVDTLTDAGKQALGEAAEKLELLPDIALYVDGHTDDRGTTEYNMSLGERRAKTVVDYLKHLGVDEARLNIVSFGEETPMAKGHTNVANAKNRRVEFRIMRGDVEFVLEEGELVDDSGEPIHAQNPAE